MLSESTEMYLITIYRLTVDEPEASISDVARLMGVHHSSASEKVKYLGDKGYVKHELHGGVTLSDEGQRIAVNVLRKHRLIKTFLVNKAGYSIDDVYDEACRLEHAISDRLANALESMLDFPDVDPHGYPIPAQDGSIAEVHYRTLNDYAPGDKVIVRRVNALDQEKLSYLRQLGLVPDTPVNIQRIEPFDGPLILDVNGKTIAIAPSLAQEIEVDTSNG